MVKGAKTQKNENFLNSDSIFQTKVDNVRVKLLVAQPCPILGDPTACSPPGFSVHGIFQARVLEWGAIAFSDMYARYTLIYIARLSLSDLFHSV